MLDYLHKTKQYLWIFVEIGFLTVLTIILIHLILGPNSGVGTEKAATPAISSTAIAAWRVPTIARPSVNTAQ